MRNKRHQHSNKRYHLMSCSVAGLDSSALQLLPGATPPGFDPLSVASDPVLVPSAPSAPPALVPGPGGASAFSNDPTVDRSLFDRLRPGRSLEEVGTCDSAGPVKQALNTV